MKGPGFRSQTIQFRPRLIWRTRMKCWLKPMNQLWRHHPRDDCCRTISCTNSTADHKLDVMLSARIDPMLWINWTTWRTTEWHAKRRPRLTSCIEAAPPHLPPPFLTGSNWLFMMHFVFGGDISSSEASSGHLSCNSNRNNFPSRVQSSFIAFSTSWKLSFNLEL